MSKYTQGPWSDESHSMGQVVVVTDASGQPVARMNSLSVEVNEANARLIAASPELLEALQQAVGSLEWAASVIGDIPPKCDYMERIEEAKAVIAKATGEQA